MNETVLKELSRFPRRNLAFLPTPVHELPKLTALLRGPRIWMKRDDQTGLAMGGNKARQLEFLVADARERDAKVLITMGAQQSNHARMTCAAACREGLKAHIILAGHPTTEATGNLLLDQLLGATITFAGTEDRLEIALEMERQARMYRSQGITPYLIPMGGSCPVGILGFVLAYVELMNQSTRTGVAWDGIVIASHSGGSQAGLEVGRRLLFPDGPGVLGVAVGHDGHRLAVEMAEKVNDTARLLGSPIVVPPDDLELVHDYVGPGYAMPTPASTEATETLAREEGVFLDPVYTSKAMAALIGLTRRGRWEKGHNILFWHTGGSVALFARQFSPAHIKGIARGS